MTKKLEDNYSIEFNKHEYLKNLHTKQLLNLRDEIYKITPSEEEKKLLRPIISSEEELYRYLNESEVHYDVSNSFKNWYVTLNDVREELKTREHIPNKTEAKEIRQHRAKNKMR